jgi:DNA invertase Pin-like site-specific DNA recombinase
LKSIENRYKLVQSASEQECSLRSVFGTEGCWINRSADDQSNLEEIEMVMDVLKMLAELRQEREQIEEAIVTLERLARGRGKRRGRPPAWMAAIKRRGRPPGSKNRPKEEVAA